MYAIRRGSIWTIRAILVIVLVVWSLAPILWNILTSLKTRRDILADTPKLFFTPHIDAYTNLFEDPRGTFWTAIINSVVVSAMSTLLIVLLGSLAAYAFARFRFRLSGTFFSGFLATRLLPPIVAVLPLYVLASSLGLIDTQTILIVIYLALHLPLAIWLLRQYFDTIPVEVEEAAQTDGANRLQVIRRVSIPLAMPGIIAVAILMFVESWNEFMFALIFTDSYGRTLPVVLSEGQGELVTDFAGIAALATVQMLPVLLLALFCQRFLVGGLTAGAVK